MVALKLQSFGGMIPTVDVHLLPDNQAGLSENAWVVPGTVEGFREPVQVHTLANPSAGRVFRIPKQYFSKEYMPDSWWLEFVDRDTDVISSPSVGDTFERFYWCSPSEQPKYNTKARIAAGQAPFIIGVPAPTTAPGASVSGGVAPTETRAYVYTWVSTYGEEGPPSPPVLATGNANGTWTITTTVPGAAATNRSLNRVRIYRTITGTSGSTTYFYVGDMAIASTSFTDNVATNLVAANRILSSTFYEPPPIDLKGMIAMPNGIIAGFRANEIWFSEPYLPHAWPSPYALAVADQVVGLGVIGQSIIVCTASAPYTISGINPSTMAISRMAFIEPCLSRGSIVSTPVGVLYASPNGLALANPGQVQIVSRSIFSTDVWQDRAKTTEIARLRASIVNNAYYGWGSSADGCFQTDTFDNNAFAQEDFSGAYDGIYIDVNDPRISYTRLKSDDPNENCFRDTWTGETLLIRDGKVLWLDLSPTRGREKFRWRSKVFEGLSKQNFSALHVQFDGTDAISGPLTGGVWDDTIAWDDTGYWYDSETTIYGTVRVYADGRLVLSRDLRQSGELIRLPSGFKATYWQFEVEAIVRIKKIEVATSAKELGLV